MALSTQLVWLFVLAAPVACKKRDRGSQARHRTLEVLLPVYRAHAARPDESGD